jgi:AcrR family transcriptional regulator
MQLLLVPNAVAEGGADTVEPAPTERCGCPVGRRSWPVRAYTGRSWPQFGGIASDYTKAVSVSYGSDVSETGGRRERKKLQTREALSAAALRLFLKSGYEDVTVVEIADAADMALTTLFKHFPGGKETLIFDDGTQRQAALIAAVTQRATDQSVLEALREFMATRGPFRADLRPHYRSKAELIGRTPALRLHAQRLWTDLTDDLAGLIADQAGRDRPDIAIRALARYVLEIPSLAAREERPRAALDEIFDHLILGWPGV